MFWKGRFGRILFYGISEWLVQAPGKNRHLDPKESTKPCLVPLRITPIRSGPPPLRRLLCMVCEMMLGLVIAQCYHAVILKR